MSKTDKNIERWRIKKLIKTLNAAKCNGTGQISLIIPPCDQISRVTRMLHDAFETASNIKSRVERSVNCQSISGAILRLNHYNSVPRNGLVLYTGTIVTDEGKEEKLTVEFEPFKQIDVSLYHCDDKFHTEPLNRLLECDYKFGFIVMDGDKTLFGKLSGKTREVLHKFTVHRRRDLCAPRFGPVRTEERHNYVRKAAELATKVFINHDTSQPNVSALVLAGSAGFRTELCQFDMLDPRLQAKILTVVDVSYGGEHGFHQAVELSSESRANVKAILATRLIEETHQDTDKYVFGVDDTLKCLDIGAVEILILWENLDINRYILKDSTTGKTIVKHLDKFQEADESNFRHSDTNAELEVKEKMSLLDWLVDEYKKFGCTIEFVTNKSCEGSQFCRGFGGIGGILRYQVDLGSFDDLSDDEENRESS